MNTHKRLLSLALLSASFTAHALPIVDADSDGLIEINSLDDLNEMRNSLNGAALRGSTVGCPNNVCWGYELTRDLDFDTNDNDVIDAGDWNSGQPWVPVGDASTPFAATFNGNGHTLSHLTVSSSGNTTFGKGHGLFGTTDNAVVRSLGLLDISITVLDDLQRLGAVAGEALNSQIKDVYVERASIQGHSSGSLSIGGLAGLVGNGEVSNSRFSGTVSGNHAAGLIGYLDRSTVLSSYASGQVTGKTSAAGLIDNLKNSGLKSSYSNVQVTSNLSAAGLITFATYDDAAQNGTDSALIESSYALGAITVQSRNAGGLINSLATYNDALATIVNSYSKNVITANINNVPEYYATLIKSYVLQGGISITLSYWVKNPNGSVLANNGTTVGTGELLADMHCASNPVNNNCAKPLLLSNWDNAVWDFGTTSQLPALKLKSNNPWMSTDTPGGNGDYETIARIKERKPEYACDTPTAFYAKEKNKGYVFNAKTPDVLRSFSGSAGLVCVHADQTSGSCANYEVSYLCSTAGVNYWTNWISNDTPNGTGDYENAPSGCAATPISVRARGVGKTTVYYSPQQKLNTFNLTDGLTCLNSDNACKDYEVRMTCEVLGDR